MTATHRERILAARDRCLDQQDRIRRGRKLEPGEVVVTPLSLVKPQRVEWLWPGRIPYGKLSILEGDPGVGKSTLMIDVAARLTRGEPFPDTDGCPSAANVVYLGAGEDALGDVLAPRLLAADADRDRFFAVRGIGGQDGYPKALKFPYDVGPLATTIQEYDAELVVVESIMDTIAMDRDSYKEQDVRSALRPLADAAEATGAAVVVLRHFTKDVSKAAIYRGGGSGAFAQLARSILMVGQDPENEQRRVLASVKHNLTAPPTSLAFELVERGDHGAAVVAWQGVSGHSAAALHAAARDQSDGSPVEDARTFLRDLLADGPVEARALEREARAAGIAERTLRRAKQALGVRSCRVGGTAGRGHWVVSLPSESPKAAKAATSTLCGRLSDANSTQDAVNPLGTGDSLRRPDPTTVAALGAKAATAPQKAVGFVDEYEQAEREAIEFFT